MIYMKFLVPANQEDPTNYLMVETEHYKVTKSHAVNGRDRVDIYDDKDRRYALGNDGSKGDWLQCYVMSETGSTIDVIRAPAEGVK